MNENASGSEMKRVWVLPAENPRGEPRRVDQRREQVGAVIPSGPIDQRQQTA